MVNPNGLMGYSGGGFIGLKYDVNPKVSCSFHHTIYSLGFWNVSWVESEFSFAKGLVRCYTTYLIIKKKKKKH